MRMKFPDLEFFLLAFAIAIVACVDLSVFFYLHGWDDFLSLESLVGLLCALGFSAVGLIHLKNSRSSSLKRSLLWLEIWKNNKSNLVLNLFAALGARLKECLLLITLIGSVYLAFCSTNICISFLLSDVKQYSLAERLYKITPWPLYKEDMTFIGLIDKFSDTNNTVNLNMDINVAIRDVYGDSSPQVAHRRSLIAERYRVCAVNNFLADKFIEAGWNYSSSLFWYQNALSDHRKLLNRFEMAEDLSNIAYCAARLEMHEESIQAQEEASIIIGNLNSQNKLQAIIKRLELASRICGVKPFPNKPGSIELQNRNGLLDATTIAIFIPTFILYLLLNSESKSLYCRFRARSLNRLISSRALASDIRLKALHELSSIYLFLNKYEDAEKCSLKLLACAEMNH